MAMRMEASITLTAPFRPRQPDEVVLPPRIIITDEPVRVLLTMQLRDPRNRPEAIITQAHIRALKPTVQHQAIAGLQTPAKREAVL